MKQILVQCDTCEGTGKTPLSEHLKNTLALVGRKGRTAEQIRAASGETAWTSINAFNNRLEKLRALGLVGRHREGKFYYYSTITPRNGK